MLIAIALGIVVGHFFPDTGEALKPLGDGFIALIKMMIAPVIFCTVVHGIASMSDLKKVGRIGVKTLIYFEVVSTLALAIGLLVGEIVQPGAGFNIDPATLDPKAVAELRHPRQGGGHRRPPAGDHSRTPSSARSPAATCCRCCWSSILTGFAVARMGAVGEQRSTRAIDMAGKVFFRIIAHDRARGADRRVRRHGLHHRRVRRRLAGATSAS